MRKIFTFALSLGFFILLPNALADDADGLVINTPTHLRQIQTDPTTPLLTLRVDNIQVQAQWHVRNARDAFMVDDGKLFLTMTTLAPGVHRATVLVEDRFDLLNTLYINLTAQAIITIDVASLDLLLLADAPLLFAAASVAATVHTFSAYSGQKPYNYTLVGPPDYFALTVADNDAALIYDGGGDADQQYTLTIAASDVNTIVATAQATVTVGMAAQARGDAVIYIQGQPMAINGDSLFNPRADVLLSAKISTTVALTGPNNAWHITIHNQAWASFATQEQEEVAVSLFGDSDFGRAGTAKISLLYIFADNVMVPVIPTGTRIFSRLYDGEWYLLIDQGGAEAQANNAVNFLALGNGQWNFANGDSLTQKEFSLDFVMTITNNFGVIETQKLQATYGVAPDFSLVNNTVLAVGERQRIDSHYPQHTTPLDVMVAANTPLTILLTATAIDHLGDILGDVGYINRAATITATVTIIPASPLSLADAPRLTVANAGQIYTFVATHGYPPYTYSLVADSAQYFTLAQNGVLSLLAGASIGFYTLSVHAHDKYHNTAQAVATLSVAPPLVLSLPRTLTATTGIAGVLHSYLATGGAGDKTYTLVDDKNYFSLSAHTVLLLNDQALIGLYTLALAVSDDAAKITATVIVNVIPAPITFAGVDPMLTVQLYANRDGAFIAFTFHTAGGLGAHTYTVLSTNRNFAIRQIAHYRGILEVANKVAEGIYPLTLQVEDDATVRMQQTMTIIILHQPTIKSLSAGTNGITVIWQTVSHADSYFLYRYTDTTNETIIATLTTSPYVDTSAIANTLYFYRLSITRGSNTYTSPIAAAFGLGESSPQLLDFSQTYYSSPEIEAQMRVLAAAYPQYATFTVIGQSIEGRNIAALKITDYDVDDDKAVAVFFGGYHAREWIAYNVPHMIGEYLITAAAATETKMLTTGGVGYNLSPAELLTKAEVWVVPAVNPDGREFSKISRGWRKNMRDNRDGTFGVDLNRNHSYQWGELPSGGSSGKTEHETYRGTHANSEPETQAVCRLLYSLARKPTMLISYHSYGQLILYPWGWGREGSTPGYESLQTSNPIEYAYIHGIAVTMSAVIKGAHGKSYRAGEISTLLYTANGDLTNWSYAVFDTPSYTIELRPAGSPGFVLPENEIWPTFTENLPAALYSIDRAIANKDREYAGERVDAVRGAAECNPE